MRFVAIFMLTAVVFMSLMYLSAVNPPKAEAVPI